MFKRICLIIVTSFLMSTLVFGASIPLNAIWDPNIDDVTIGYKLYRTDGTRLLIGDIPGENPTFPYSFTVTVPDGSTGTVTFIVVAYSTTQVSEDSNVASYPFDLSPRPAAVKDLKVTP